MVVDVAGVLAGVDGLVAVNVDGMGDGVVGKKEEGNDIVW
jgi:hypothetical protein